MDVWSAVRTRLPRTPLIIQAGSHEPLEPLPRNSHSGFIRSLDLRHAARLDPSLRFLNPSHFLYISAFRLFFGLHSILWLISLQRSNTYTSANRA
jgi:hypothetical protein